MNPFVPLTFLLVAGLIIGAYWVAVLRPEQVSEVQVKKRLRPQRKISAVRGGLLKEAERLSHVPLIERLLQHATGVTVPLRKTLRQAGLNVSVSVVLLSCACLGALVAFLLISFTGYLLVAVGGFVIAATIPIFVVRKLRERRLLKFEEQFPEAIDLIARALRAGHAFTTGLSMVGDEIPPPVGTEFKVLYEQQNFGMPLPDAFREFAERIPVIDAQFFATAVLTQRESGGNLSEVLDNLASVIRERFRVKRQVRVISAHGRITGWVLALLPPVLAVAFMIIAPQNMKLLIGDPLGVRMIIGAIVLQIIGTYAITQIVKIEY